MWREKGCTVLILLVFCVTMSPILQHLSGFISFIQFVDPDSGEVRTDFLFVENALANSKSADAQTLFTILT